MKKIAKFAKSLVKSPRTKTLALMLVCGTAAAFAQNAAGDYTAGTNALSTVTEENAFWLNHTLTKYDKMNIRLKKHATSEGFTSIIQILNFLNRFAISLISLGTIVGTLLTLYPQTE